MQALSVLVATIFWINCAFANYQIHGETCISIKGSNQIGKYSYGQIMCKENKSVNVQRIWFDNEGNCEYETSKRKEIFNERLAINCDSFSLCKVPFYRSNVNRNYTYLNLRFHCAGGPDYAVIVGGIVGGLLVICVIVASFLLRRRKCMIQLNATYDSSQGQSVADNNRDAQLMNSPDVLLVSTSHAVNVDHTTESNTYSHLRNTVDDSDVMYDHTIRHNVHDTCEGDYGIAHRRNTEDDYDMSGNYRISYSKETDPVYN